MANRTAPLRQDAAVNRERVLAEVGIGTVYRHFAGRDELLDELARRSFEPVLALAQR